MSNKEQMVGVSRRICHVCVSEPRDTYCSVCDDAIAQPAAQHQGEPYAWAYEWAYWMSTEGPKDFKRCIEREQPPQWAVESGQARNVKPLYERPAAQHQGEPVALPARRDESTASYTACLQSSGWNACLDEIAKLGPLYTHPAPVHQGEPVAWTYLLGGERRFFPTDPRPSHGAHANLITDAQPVYTHADTGESERLRAENIRLIEDRARFPDRPDDIGIMIGCHIGNLKNQAKSSEGYAKKWRWELEAVERKLSELEALCWGLIGSSGKKRAQYLEKLQAALSASADPSNDLCAEGAHEFVPFRSKCVKCGEPYSAEPSAREAQALKDESRLGIERLPAEPSAPAERDEPLAELLQEILSISNAVIYQSAIERNSPSFDFEEWAEKARAALERKP